MSLTTWFFLFPQLKIFSFPTLPLGHFLKKKTENGKFPVFFLGDTHSSIKENGIEIENGKLRWGGGDTPHMHQCVAG